jgi:hypothetical protein
MSKGRGAGPEKGLFSALLDFQKRHFLWTCDIGMFKAEIKRWKARGATLTTAKPSNLKDTLNVTNEELYPSISTVLLILYTMPASTATTERSFSALRLKRT